VGFFKKMVVADSCALYVDHAFGDLQGANGATLAVGAVLFSVQIYGDFSGYSDIAIGCAKLFGIRLRRNFDVPYFSRDIAEFWRRWHMSLTSWFRDYVYIPLGGSRVGRWKVVRNTFVIFLLSGLWHGANWTFVAWGAFHALLFLPLILLGVNRKHRGVVAEGRGLPSWREAGQMALTFALATVGWVLFRADSIGDALAYLRNMFAHGLLQHPVGFGELGCKVLMVALPLMVVVEWLNRSREHGLACLPRWRWVRWLAYMVLIFMILAFAQTGEMPFIYFQF
jgi:D-alanyl-lipoteichoic acid acyltransferase DltB (MBOAT superfamily)